MADLPDSKSGSSPRSGMRRPLLRSGTALGLILKILLLGTVAGIAVFGAFPLIEQRLWSGLAVLVAATAVLFYIYISPRNIPAKYLVPGTVFLLAFQVFPVLYTVATAFTNFGDGHRGTKQDAVARHRGRLGAARGRRGAVPALDRRQRRSADRRHRLSARRPRGAQAVRRHQRGSTRSCPRRTRPCRRPARSPRAKGYTVLTIAQAARRGEAVGAFRVPTEKGAIRSQGLSSAYEGSAQIELRRELRLHPRCGERQDLDRRRRRRLLPRRRRQRPGPGLEGQRRAAQLRGRADQPGHQPLLLPHPALELRLRAADRGAVVRASACSWRWCSTASGCAGSGCTARCSSCPTPCRRSRCCWCGATCSTPTSA